MAERIDAMLVLSRKMDQKIQIGRDITITILRVKKNSVKIGIEAPDDLPIARGELLDTAPNGQTGQGISSWRRAGRKSPARTRKRLAPAPADR